jgi:ankyrin repeat protein
MRTKLDGSTPLIKAIVMGEPTAKILEMIEAGADVNDRGGGKSTALYYAASMPDRLRVRASQPGAYETLHRPMFPIVQALVERGADVNARCIGGTTPLLAACDCGSPERVAYLISKGADVNAKEQGGATPLHAAAGSVDQAPVRGDLIAIIRTLVAHGADVNAVDNHGDTPRDWARRRKVDGYAEGAADILLGELGGKYHADIDRVPTQERGGKTQPARPGGAGG